MKQTLRTQLGYVEREYAKPALLTVGVLAVMVAETVMGWQGLGKVLGNWALAVSFALAVLQVLSSHTWGNRSAHNASRDVRWKDAKDKAKGERRDSEPRHDPALPRAMSIAAGVVSAFMGGMALVPGMITFLSSVLAGWVSGCVLATVSPLAAVGLALLLGNESEAWKVQAEWEAEEGEKKARAAQSRADGVQRRADERRRAQEQAERDQRRAEAAQGRAEMGPAERQQALLEEWRARPGATAQALARKYGVNVSTIRRDLQALAEQGLAWRDGDVVEVAA